MDLLDWKISHMDNTHSSWPSLMLIVLFRSKDIRGGRFVRPILIFRTKRSWILFRIGPERRREAEMPPRSITKDQSLFQSRHLIFLFILKVARHSTTGTEAR